MASQVSCGFTTSYVNGMVYTKCLFRAHRVSKSEFIAA